MRKSYYDLRHYWLSLLLSVLAMMLVACNTTSDKPTIKNSTRTSLTPITTVTLKPFPQTARIDAYLTKLAMEGTLGGSVLVEHNGMLFEKGYGVADKDAHILNTLQTRFRLGSVTKQFTAMAILMLQERGKLHVQDLLCRYIPDCPQDWQAITLEQLLTHTSGIPDYTDFSDFATTWTQSVSVEQLIARFKNVPLDSTPGSVFRYSSSGYVLLGYIIERITGETYATFLRKNIFEPLAMHNTGYDSQYPTLPQHATGYYKGYIKPDAYDMSVLYAAGALYSTVEDLYIWDQALATHKLVSQQVLDTMFALHVPCPPPGSPKGCVSQNDKGYGYGWFLADEAQGRLIYHVGRIDGFFAYNGFYRNKNLDVVVLSNLETTDVWQIGRTLASMV